MPYYADALPGHDRFHAARVRDMANRLADERERPVDRGVLSAAAWLHDVGRPRERAGDVDHHGEWAAVEAADRLDAEGVDPDRIEAIRHCLRAHSIRASSPEPETPEARLLFDADKLDAAGARGLLRLACIVGERSGRTGESFAVVDDASSSRLPAADLPDVGLLRDWIRERLDALYTAPGRRVGESRWQFVEAFFEQFDRELAGDAEW